MSSFRPALTVVLATSLLCACDGALSPQTAPQGASTIQLLSSLPVAYPANDVASANGFVYLTEQPHRLTIPGRSTLEDTGSLHLIRVAESRQLITESTLSVPGYPYGVVVNGHLAYLISSRAITTAAKRFERWIGFNVPGALIVVDVADPSSPDVVGTVPLPEEPALAVVSDGGLAFATDTKIYVMDMTDPSRPTLGTAIDGCASLVSDAPLGGMAVDGTRLYVACGEAIFSTELAGSATAPLVRRHMGQDGSYRTLAVVDGRVYATYSRGAARGIIGWTVSESGQLQETSAWDGSRQLESNLRNSRLAGGDGRLALIAAWDGLLVFDVETNPLRLVGRYAFEAAGLGESHVVRGGPGELLVLYDRQLYLLTNP